MVWDESNFIQYKERGTRTSLFKKISTLSYVFEFS